MAKYRINAVIEADVDFNEEDVLFRIIVNGKARAVKVIEMELTSIDEPSAVEGEE